jgi:hypothetical protein
MTDDQWGTSGRDATRTEHTSEPEQEEQDRTAGQQESRQNELWVRASFRIRETKQSDCPVNL